MIVVGDAFADMLGRDYYVQVVTPLQESMERVRHEAPLSDDP